MWSFLTSVVILWEFWSTLPQRHLNSQHSSCSFSKPRAWQKTVGTQVCGKGDGMEQKKAAESWESWELASVQLPTCCVLGPSLYLFPKYTVGKHGLGQCISNFHVHMDHLGLLLNGWFRLSRTGTHPVWALNSRSQEVLSEILHLCNVPILKLLMVRGGAHLEQQGSSHFQCLLFGQSGIPESVLFPPQRKRSACGWCPCDLQMPLLQIGNLVEKLQSCLGTWGRRPKGCWWPGRTPLLKENISPWSPHDASFPRILSDREGASCWGPLQDALCREPQGTSLSVQISVFACYRASEQKQYDFILIRYFGLANFWRFFKIISPDWFNDPLGFLLRELWTNETLKTQVNLSFPKLPAVLWFPTP